MIDVAHKYAACFVGQPSASLFLQPLKHVLRHHDGPAVNLKNLNG